MKVKHWLIISLSIVLIVCSCVAIILISVAPEHSKIGNDGELPSFADGNSIDVTEEDIQFFDNQPTDVKFGIEANNKITKSNLDNYAVVKNTRNETVDVQFSNGYICAPDGGYVPGEGYTITLKNGACFTDERIKHRDDVVFLIHKDEVFDCEISDAIKELSPNEYISFDGESKLLLKTSRFNVGDKIKFARADNHGEYAVVKVLSSASKGSNTEYTVEAPFAEEVFDELDVSQDYTLSEDNMEINQEGIDELIGVLEDVPAMSDLGYDILRYLPKISCNVEFKDGGLDLDFEIRYKLNGLWTDNKQACAKEIVRILKQFCGETIDKSLNVYLVFKVEFINKVDIHQEVSLDNGNFLLLTTNTTITRIKFYLEAEGLIVSIYDDVDGRDFGIGKDEYKEISDLLNSIVDAYDVRKEIKVATVHVTYMGLVGAGVDFYLVFNLGFRGELGVDHTVTTVQQSGVMVSGTETIPIENKSSNTTNTSLYALGIARAEFGLKLDVYVDLLYIFKAGVRLEAGVYAELGGAFAVSWGDASSSKYNYDIKENDHIHYEQQIHTALYFEAGVYFRASVFAEVNMMIAKFEISYAFVDVDCKLIEVGSKESVSILIDSDKTILMEDGKAEMPTVWISRYNIFTGEKSMEIAKKNDIVVEFDAEGLMFDENNAFVDVSGKVDVQYNVGIGIIDRGFQNIGTGVENYLFGNSVIKSPEHGELIADSMEILLVKTPKDIESFEIGVIGNVDYVEIGTSVVLSANNITPSNATFSDVAFKLKSDIAGVTLTNNVLTVSSDAQVDKEIVIGAETIKNRNGQIEAHDFVLTTKEVPLNSISVFPYREDMSEFIGGTIIPIGSTVNLSPIPYPSNAKIVELYYEVKDGYQYVQGITDGIINSDTIKIVDNIVSNSRVAIVAHATNINGEELVSRPLILDINVTVLDAFNISAEKSVVHRNEQISIIPKFTPSAARPESVEYYIASGRNLATIDANGILKINSDATLGGEIVVKAIADGVESNMLIFSVEEVYAEKIEAIFESTGNNACGMYYGATSKINVSILPKETTYANYEYEILSGGDAIIIDSFENTVYLKYNVNPDVSIRFRAKKTLNDGDETVIYSDVLTIQILTVAITDFYIFPNIENIVPGEEYQFDFSFKESEIDKQTNDYLISWKCAVISGDEFATINSDGKLVVDSNITQFNYSVSIRLTLTTANGIYNKEMTLTCKVAASDVTVSSVSQQVATSKQTQLNVQVLPLSTYVIDIAYEIVQGDTYGFIDKNGILTVYDSVNVGETILVRAVVTSLGIDDDTGEERQFVKYSSPYAITIIENPIEYISFSSTIDAICQNGSFQFSAAVYPEDATYKLINYSLETVDNGATIGSSDGILRIDPNVKVGAVIKVIAYSPLNNTIRAEHEVHVTKAQLVSFDLTYTTSANKPLITCGDQVTLSTTNPSPSYYRFDKGEVKYQIVSGEATISGDVLTVKSNLGISANTTIKIKAVASGIEADIDIEITLLQWKTTPTSFERGDDVEVLAQMSGKDGGYTIEYIFAGTREHTSEYGEITNVNNVHIYDHISGRTEITIMAVLGNLEISFTTKVKEIVSIEFATLFDINNNSINPKFENGTYSTALLHSAYRLNNSADTIQLFVKAFLSNGKVASTSSYSCVYVATGNPSYVTISGNAVSLTSNAISGGYATIRASISEGTASKNINVYCFVPAYNADSGNVNFGASGNTVFSLFGGLVNGSSTLYVPSDVENDNTAYSNFLKGDTYNFGTYFSCQSKNLNPTNLTYSATEGTITDTGVWTAATNAVGGNTFNVVVSSSNTYQGRTFGNDFTRTCSFKMPTYIYNQTQLASLNGKSGEYYLRKDLSFSGYWTPITTFSGKFDGGGHTISNVKIKVSTDLLGDVHFGLFENNNGTIQNLSMSNFSIDYEITMYINIYFGAIAAINNGTIKNCSSSGTLNLDKLVCASVGGIVYENKGTIDKCVNNTNIKSDFTSGGISAVNSATITNSTNNGSIYVYSNSNGYVAGQITGNGSYGNGCKLNGMAEYC